jgi:hypothetical protein
MNFEKPVFRFLSLELTNMKNVEHGIVHFDGYTKKDAWKKYNAGAADVMGIYGQNGSGKTTVIQSLVLVRDLVLGTKLFTDTKEIQQFIPGELITKGKDSLTAVYRFLITDSCESKIIEYSFKFSFRANTDSAITLKNIVILESESFKVLNLDLSPTGLFISYSAVNKQIVEPVDLYKRIVKKDSELAVTFQLCKVLSLKECSTFLFSTELQKADAIYSSGEIFVFMKAFRKYMNADFCVITKGFTDLAGTDIIPLAVKNDDSYFGSFIHFMAISLRGSQFVECKQKPVFEALIEELNVVINSIIPDLNLKMTTLRTELSNNNRTGDVVEVVSVRNGNEIPLRYESEGIKKLLSILNLLVYMHNNKNVFVAVDELDASIFEFLLGEILTMLSESGKGQLLFTSHNLYPLELLDKDSILFTTTNPQNRFIRFKYVKPNNNLRDLYLKTIRLGGQDESVYSESDSADMRLSFYTAGKKFEQFLDSLKE